MAASRQPGRRLMMKMQKHRLVYDIGLLIIAAVIEAALAPIPGACQPPGLDRQANEAGNIADDAEKSLNLPTYLYFVDPKNGFLSGEQRRMPASDDPVTQCRLIIEGLIKGPEGGDLIRTIPEGTRLRAVYITAGKTAYVDFTQGITTGHPGGVKSELMTVYSIVNSLVLNVSGVDQVQILIGGQDAETLAGHIDIRFPLKADMLLIR